MKLNFEWDDSKAKENFKKHGVGFDEATTIFSDPFSMTIPDPDHSIGEERHIELGTSDKNRVLVVAYAERGSSMRIINCRKATSRERKLYKEGSD